MPAELRYVVCDVFTDRPLAGNQLVVSQGEEVARPATLHATA